MLTRVSRLCQEVTKRIVLYLGPKELTVITSEVLLQVRVRFKTTENEGS